MSRRGKAWALFILHILTEFVPPAQRLHRNREELTIAIAGNVGSVGGTALQPWRKALHPTPDPPVMQQRESPVQDKAEQQQLLPTPLQAVAIYTAGTRANPQSLMRADPRLSSSLLAQALICTLNPCLRRPNVLQHCCCAAVCFDSPFWPKCS